MARGLRRCSGGNRWWVRVEDSEELITLYTADDEGGWEAALAAQLVGLTLRQAYTLLGDCIADYRRKSN